MKICCRHFVVLLGLVLLPGYAFAQKASMEKGIQAYKQKKWDDALGAFQKALRELKGKPVSQKAGVHVYLGLTLLGKGEKGLAWKAFEQALYANGSVGLPSKSSEEAVDFFARVKKRVKRRGGDLGDGVVPSTGFRLTYLSYAFLGLAGATVIGGVILLGSNQAARTEAQAWQEKAAKENPPDASSIQNLSTGALNSAELQGTIAIASFVAAGLFVGGAVVTGLFHRPSVNKTHTAPSLLALPSVGLSSTSSSPATSSNHL